MGWVFDAKLGMNELSAAVEMVREYEQLCIAANDDIRIAWSYARKGRLEQAYGNIENGNELICKGIEKLREIGHIDYIKDIETFLKR